MMNDANTISKKTKLFGFIGEHAGVSRFSAVINKMFKANSDDVMMIPMNIREDDLYFTLSNMKKSEVDGAVVSNEYVCEIVDLLDEASTLVRRTGMCDVLFREGERLRGDIFSIRVLVEHLKDLRVSRVAMIGTSAHAKAFSFLSCGFDMSYFGENLEELMSFTKELEIEDADINRIASGMSLDLSSYDVVLDFSRFDSLGMIESLPNYSLDMKNTKEFSALKKRADELEASYTSYDDIVEKLASQIYRTIK